MLNDNFRKKVGKPSRPYPQVSLRSPSIVSNSSSKVLSRDSTKSRKLTRGGFMLDPNLGPSSVKRLLNALRS